MKDRNMLLSGDDSGLISVWEEVCVQVQFEQSFWWDAYETTITAIVRGLVEGLEQYELQAVWLFTPEGKDWHCESEEDRRSFEPYVDHVVQYILREFVLRQAADWSNQHIRAYLDR